LDATMVDDTPEDTNEDEMLPADSTPFSVIDHAKLAKQDDGQESFKDKTAVVEEVKEPAIGLHVRVYRGYQANRAQYWWDTICSNTKWYRVKYKSGRFQKECQTPCWTTFFGGRPEYTPYVAVPEWLQPLVEKISRDLQQPFNAMLLRLYFDGNDEIAWHTDGRTFLGPTPTIASLSFGANATFEMRRMTNVWPPLDGSSGNCIDTSTPQMNFVVGDGDMLVMMGDTQKHWHHRVPKEKGRRPRLNINFRYIKTGSDAERGQKTYYKYMVHGDDDRPKSYSYHEIMAKRGGLLNFALPKRKCLSGTPVKKVKAGRAFETAKLFRKANGSNSDDAANSISLSDESAYLATEEVDESSFEALPVDIQKELVSEWKLRQGRIEPSGTKRLKEQVIHQFRRKKGSSGASNDTLDAFFSCKEI